MQTRSSDENSVCLSVRPSIRHTHALWQNGRKICQDLYTIRKNIYRSFLRRRMVGGGATPSRWNFGSTDPSSSEIVDFQPIIARSSSTVTPSEKSLINANRKSTTRFPSDRVGAKSSIFTRSVSQVTPVWKLSETNL